MAGKKKTKVDEMPEGFAPVSSKMDGFFICEEGNSVQGTLLDSFVNSKSKFGPKKVYKVEITSGTTRVMTADDGETDAEAGAVIGIDEKGYLKKLGDIAKGSEIFIRCTGREETAKKGQQPAWMFSVGWRDGKIPF